MQLVEAGDRAAVERYVPSAPYVLSGVYASVGIHENAWRLGPPEMTLVKKPNETPDQTPETTPEDSIG